MKLGFFKSTKVTVPPANPPAHSRRIKSFASNLYDDPAFSSDPHTHPLFVSSADSLWVSPPPPGPGHPRLKAQRRQGLSSSQPDGIIPTELEEIYPPQPPNTPMPADGPAEYQRRIYYVANGDLTREDSPPPNHAWGSSPPRSPLRTTQGSGASNPPTDNYPRNEKSGGFTSFFRRMKISPSENPQHTGNEVSPPPPPYDAVASNSTLPPRLWSHEGRSAPRTAEARPPPRTRDLDMIDELDETNPLGLSLHHGGPYEAVYRVAEASRSRDTWDTSQTDSRDRKKGGHRSKRRESEPTRVSPGQIFPPLVHLHPPPPQQEYYNGESEPHTDGLLYPSAGTPRDGRRHDRRHSSPRAGYSPIHRDPPPGHEYFQPSHHSGPESWQVATEGPYRSQLGAEDLSSGRRDSSPHVDRNAPPPPSWPVFNSPPVMQHAASFPIAEVPDPRNRMRQYNSYPAPPVLQMPPVEPINHIPEGYQPTAQVRRDPAPPPRVPENVQDQDARSAFTSNSNGSQSERPLPSHRPKRLVMPAPLQPSLMPSRNPQQPQPVYQGQENMGQRPLHHPLASRSSISIPSNADHARNGEDVNGRKRLRKRASVTAATKGLDPSVPLTSVAFSAHLSHTPQIVARPLPKQKGGRAQKVLSKKRTDL